MGLWSRKLYRTQESYTCKNHSNNTNQLLHTYRFTYSIVLQNRKLMNSIYSIPRKTHLDLLPMSCWAHPSDLWMSEALQLAHTHAFTDSLVFTFIRLQTCRHKKMPPMNPVISSKNYKVMVLTFNRNITLETYTILSIPGDGKEFVSSVGISIKGPPPLYVYGSQSNREKAESPCILAMDCHRHKLHTKQSRWQFSV